MNAVIKASDSGFIICHNKTVQKFSACFIFSYYIHSPNPTWKVTLNKKISLLLTLFFSVWAIPSFSQIGWDSLTIKSRDRLFFSMTYNFLPDIEKGPVTIYPNYISDNLPKPPYPQDGYAAIFLFNTDFASIGGKIRYNLIQFNSRTSLSLSISPSFGAGLTVVDEQNIHQIMPYAGGSYNIPLFIEFNYGNYATHNSFDDYGLFVFAGVEYTGLLLQNSPANGELMDSYGNFYTAEFTNHWVEAALGLGIRYKNCHNVEREIFLKYGVGPSQFYFSPYNEIQAGHPWTLKLTLARDF